MPVASPSPPKRLSGVAWVTDFPTSRKVEDLAEPFRTNVGKFLAAITAAGGKSNIAATRRPKERAFLMHWSFKVASGVVAPEDVPAMAGVDIEWVHTFADGKKNATASRKAAKEMVAGYDIAFAPALKSHHIAGLALDMSISWTTAELKIKDAANREVIIKGAIKNGSNAELHAVGKSYGVIKLASDPPHWSADGH